MNIKYIISNIQKTHNASGGWLDESRVDLKIYRYVQRLLFRYLFTFLKSSLN